jgi:hypothetical protein
VGSVICFHEGSIAIFCKVGSSFFRVCRKYS